MQYTKQQIQNWRAYERVRAGGRYNMFDARARAATKLSRDDYFFVLTNFTLLKEAAAAARAK
jgi:hypothetical protein